MSSSHNGWSRLGQGLMIMNYTKWLWRIVFEVASYTMCFSHFILYVSCSPLIHALRSIMIHATPLPPCLLFCYDIGMYTNVGILKLISSSFNKHCNNCKRWIYDKFYYIYLNEGKVKAHGHWRSLHALVDI